MQSLRMALSLRRAEITASLLEKHGHAVLDGPFCGMTLLDETSWSDGDLAPKLLGCYEEELHKAITTAVGRNPTVIVNVGCAEGFYAVGLARLVPQARIFAFDTDPTAQAICRRAAERNGVADRTIVGAACSIEALRNVITSATGTVLLFVDCEGAELALLDPTQLPELRICDIIVECHDFINRSITPTLVQRLSNTHHVENIVEGPRNPNRFVSLHQLGSSDRWLAMDEGRPQTMNWLVCWTRRS
jgi:hypothetical protein